jgi:hypothetical protein
MTFVPGAGTGEKTVFGPAIPNGFAFQGPCVLKSVNLKSRRMWFTRHLKTFYNVTNSGIRNIAENTGLKGHQPKKRLADGKEVDSTNSLINSLVNEMSLNQLSREEHL